MEKEITDSIEKTETVLTELLDACRNYKAALAEKDYEKAKVAMGVFDEYTEKHWFKLSVNPPIQNEDTLAEIFGTAA